jgi:hypothetical protein
MAYRIKKFDIPKVTSTKIPLRLYPRVVAKKFLKQTAYMLSAKGLPLPLLSVTC